MRLLGVLLAGACVSQPGTAPADAAIPADACVAPTPTGPCIISVSGTALTEVAACPGFIVAGSAGESLFQSVETVVLPCGTENSGFDVAFTGDPQVKTYTAGDLDWFNVGLFLSSPWAWFEATSDGVTTTGSLTLTLTDATVESTSADGTVWTVDGTLDAQAPESNGGTGLEAIHVDF